MPPPASCPATTGGPTMVPVCGGYCIDSTEVTADQYAAWIATNPLAPPTVPGGVCSGKTSYNPGSGSSNYPVTNVDWCDAYAYCAGVGKRLCGKIGGGSVDYNAGSNDAAQDQWYNACVSGNAKNMYPYGNTYQADTCNGADYWGPNGYTRTLPVGSLSGCTSSVAGYAGIFDLSGNVMEWEDSCTGTSGENDGCNTRGGWFGQAGTTMSCAFDGGYFRYGKNHNGNGSIGFRCCGG